jgi:hypothetical protein
VTREQWRLADRVTPVLETEIGMTDTALAEVLSVTVADLVPVLQVLYRQQRVDRCWSWTVSVPRPGEGRRAA